LKENNIQASTVAGNGRAKRLGGEGLDPGKPADIKVAFNIGRRT
jgi:hypothetical protein